MMYNQNNTGDSGNRPDWNMADLLMARIDQNFQDYNHAIKSQDYPLAFRMLRETIWVSCLFKINDTVEKMKAEEKKQYQNLISWVEDEFKKIDGIIKGGKQSVNLNMFVIAEKVYNLRKVIDNLMWVAGLLYPRKEYITFKDRIARDFL